MATGKIPNIHQKVNPRQNANILSIITFFYTIPIFRKALKKDLEEKDIYSVLNNYKSSKLGDKLEKTWEEEKLKPNPSLFCAILRVFAVEYFLIGLVTLLTETVFIVARPLAFGKLISYFTPNQTTVSKQEAYMYAVLVIFTRIGRLYFEQFFVLVLKLLSLKVRIATCSLIYRKSLKISDATIGEITTGKVVTLITKDVHLFDSAVHFLNDTWVCSTQVVILTYIMYRHIQFSTFIGVAFLLLMIPVQVFIGKKALQYRLKTVTKTDKRIRLILEILTGIKIIKMYSWEEYFKKVVAALRKKEIRHLRIIYYLLAVALTIGLLSQRISLYLIITSYIYYFQNHLTAEKAYVVIGCFEILCGPLTYALPYGIVHISQAITAMRRIKQYLLTPEIKQNFEEKCGTKIVFENCDLELSGKIALIRDINIEVNSGVNVLTGKVGSGKSTLLKLILQDRTPTKGNVKIFGTVSYASQDPWIFPGTVKENILFGQQYDHLRYQKILKICSLERDLAQFSLGDGTCLTAHGLNLSKGQKARINLARAVYKNADVYLLDDPLSSVDVQVAQSIFQECIQTFLKDKVSIVVSHQTQIFNKVNNILLIENQSLRYVSSGDILKTVKSRTEHNLNNKWNGSIMARDNEIEVDEGNELASLIPQQVDYINALYREHREKGQVNFEVYKAYINSGGGWMLMFVIILLTAAIEVSTRGTEYVISKWVDLEQQLNDFVHNSTTNTTEFKDSMTKRDYTMIIFSSMIIVAMISSVVGTFSYFAFTGRASIKIHKIVFSKVMDATMHFFDKNLSGIILNRFSKDIGNIDDFLPNVAYDCIRVILALVLILIMIDTVNPWFILPTVLFAIILYFMRTLCVPATRSIKRLEASTRSPVVGQLSASLEGLTTIRASQVQKYLIAEFDRHQDQNSSTVYTYITTTTAFSYFLDITCICYISIIIFSFLVFDLDSMAGEVGLAVSQSFHMSGILQYGIRQWAELENQMTSVERVYEYTKLKSEDKIGEKREEWPQEGKIQYKDVKLRYTKSDDYVLNGINFVIEGNQKIGIIGRTGAGKSSIISTLLKLYEFEGSIIIDDVEIKQLQSHFLRSKISIIPQDPVFFTGSLRSNIDPNNEYSDELLWKALEDIEMKTTIANSTGGLNCEIHEGGINFSVGQRQLLCLVRAILRNNKVLILDEATANIDEDTDALVQKAINTNFTSSTVITVAHRLQTIMNSDKIMVVDDGCILEYDKPETLLRNKGGWFYKLAKRANLLKDIIK